MTVVVKLSLNALNKLFSFCRFVVYFFRRKKEIAYSIQSYNRRDRRLLHMCDRKQWRSCSSKFHLNYKKRWYWNFDKANIQFPFYFCNSGMSVLCKQSSQKTKYLLVSIYGIRNDLRHEKLKLSVFQTFLKEQSKLQLRWPTFVSIALAFAHFWKIPCIDTFLKIVLIPFIITYNK